jgi:hypothetical protein
VHKSKNLLAEFFIPALVLVGIVPTVSANGTILEIQDFDTENTIFDLPGNPLSPVDTISNSNQMFPLRVEGLVGQQPGGRTLPPFDGVNTDSKFGFGAGESLFDQGTPPIIDELVWTFRFTVPNQLEGKLIQKVDLSFDYIFLTQNQDKSGDLFDVQIDSFSILSLDPSQATTRERIQDNLNVYDFRTGSSGSENPYLNSSTDISRLRGQTVDLKFTLRNLDNMESLTSAISIDEIKLIAKPVPEPLTVIASGIAIGFGALCQREYAKKRGKINKK